MAAGAVIAAAAAAAKRRRDDEEAIVQAMETWSRLARARDLVFSSVTGVPAIAGKILGIPCRVAIERDRSQFASTRVVAVPIEENGRVGVVPNPGGVLGFLKHLVTQDIEVGDPEFDEAFLVRSDPKDLAPALLGPTLRAYISPLAVRKLTLFLYEPGNVTAHFSHVEADGEWIAAALDAVVEAARFTRPHTEPFR